MSHILVGKVRVNNKVVYTEEIINLLMLGNSSRHQLYVDSLESGPITFRKTAEIYSAQFDDHHWNIDKKQTRPQKLYVIDENTVLNCGTVTVSFQKIKEGQLEVIKETTPMTRRQNISELLSQSKNEDKGNLGTPAVKFLSKIRAKLKLKSSSQKKEKAQQSIQFDHLAETNLHGLITLPSILFNACLAYLLLFQINKLPQELQEKIANFKLSILDLSLKYLPVNKFEGILSKVTEKLPIKIDPSNFSIINQTIVEIFSLTIFFLVLLTLTKLIQIIILGSTASFFISGIEINSGPFAKRVKLIIRELLSLILFPLNIFNPFGLIPIKSLPDFILRIKFLKKSNSRIIFGGLMNLAVTISFLFFPLLEEKVHQLSPRSLLDLPSKQEEKDISLLNIQINQKDSVELALPSDFKILSKEIKNGLPLTIIETKNSKASIYGIDIEENFLEKIRVTFLKNLPTSMIMYPALFLEEKIKKNILFHQSTKLKRQKELSQILYSSVLLSPSLESIKNFSIINGPFFFGPSKSSVLLQQKINISEEAQLYRAIVSERETILIKAQEKLYFLQVDEEEKLRIFYIKFDDKNDIKAALESLINNAGTDSTDPQANLEDTGNITPSKLQNLLKNLPANALKKIEDLKKSMSL